MSTPEDPWDTRAFSGLTDLRSGRLDRAMEEGWDPELGDASPEIQEFVERPVLSEAELLTIAVTNSVFEERKVLPLLKPGEILDERNSVVEWVANPPHRKSLSAFIGDDRPGSSALTPSCLNYWLQGADVNYAAALIKNVLSEEIYYVSEDMARMTDAASRSLPDPIEVNEAMLPAPAGLIRLEQPRYSLDRRSRRLGTTAFGWRLITAQDRKRYLLVISFSHREDRVDEINAMLERETPGKMYLLAPLMVSSFDVYPLHSPIQIADKYNVSDGIFLFATFLMLGQKIASSTRANIDRHAMRRAMRLKLSGSVTLVNLRQVEYVGEETEGHKQVAWSCRWFVRLHWRHLDRPSDPSAMWCEKHQRKCKLVPIDLYPKNKHRTDLPWKDPSRRLHRLVR